MKRKVSRSMITFGILAIAIILLCSGYILWEQNKKRTLEYRKIIEDEISAYIETGRENFYYQAYTTNAKEGNTPICNYSYNKQGLEKLRSDILQDKEKFNSCKMAAANYLANKNYDVCDIVEENNTFPVVVKYSVKKADTYGVVTIIVSEDGIVTNYDEYMLTDEELINIAEHAVWDFISCVPVYNSNTVYSAVNNQKCVNIAFFNRGTCEEDSLNVYIDKGGEILRIQYGEKNYTSDEVEELYNDYFNEVPKDYYSEYRDAIYVPIADRVYDTLNEEVISYLDTIVGSTTLCMMEYYEFSYYDVPDGYYIEITSIKEDNLVDFDFVYSVVSVTFEIEYNGILLDTLVIHYDKNDMSSYIYMVNGNIMAG